ncbi:type III PLP-dependent enzyme [Kitasatospora terrestris]|uniref:Type III PLP-dependent enzyme n=1 Tax=Kitasatospora terrestris TaxID=258051 RepID=A0ABP9DE09_9ACTN
MTPGHIDWTGIAEEYGTPTYVYDGDWLVDNFRRLRSALHPALEVFFSLKSNPNRGVYDVLRSAGARAEVSSLAELELVLRAGTDPENIMFLGPGKSAREIARCIDAGVYAVVCESFTELAAIDRAAEAVGRRIRVLLRINPPFSVAGSRLTMGGKPTQFGIDEEAVLSCSPFLERLTNTDVAGIQVYLGTRILDPSVIVRNTAYVLDLARRVKEATGIRLDAVDVGGGLGVAYFDGERDLDLAELTEGLNPLIEEFATAQPETRLIMESGRFLVAGCGTYLVRVRYTKKSMGQSYAVVDGGTHHHMAAVGIGSFVKRNFPIAELSRGGAGEAPVESWNIAGPLCTPNDTIAKGVALRKDLEPGDLIGVRRSGAYGPTASPTLFLSHGYPGEVVVLRGRTYLVRAPDTTEDILSRQSTHADLARAAEPPHRPALTRRHNDDEGPDRQDDDLGSRGPRGDADARPAGADR